jgi:hypothetical protein
LKYWFDTEFHVVCECSPYFSTKTYVQVHFQLSNAGLITPRVNNFTPSHLCNNLERFQDFMEITRLLGSIAGQPRLDPSGQGVVFDGNLNRRHF